MIASDWPGRSPQRHTASCAHVLPARRGPAAFASAARLVERVPVALLTVPDSVQALTGAADALESLPKLD